MGRMRYVLTCYVIYHTDLTTQVAHVASPWSFSLESWEDYRDPAVKGTTNVLEQALKYPQIKAVSVISSFAAIGDTCEPWYNFKGKVYTEADWNPYTAEQCEHITPELEGRKTLIWYCVSKKEAEKAAEAVGKRSETHYALSMMCPPGASLSLRDRVPAERGITAIYGPPIHIADGSNGALKDADVSTETLYEVLASGKDTKFRDIAFPAYAEVRTVAACTFNAIDKQISGRFLICDGYHDFVLMNRVAHKVRPDLSEKGVIPKGKPEGKTDIEDGSYRLDACKAKKELGLQREYFGLSLYRADQPSHLSRADGQRHLQAV